MNRVKLVVGIVAWWLQFEVNGSFAYPMMEAPKSASLLGHMYAVLGEDLQVAVAKQRLANNATHDVNHP